MVKPGDGVRRGVRRPRKPAPTPVVPKQRPAVMAHRGASVSNAEHTLGAYTTALELGAEGIECDVRLTADGHLVCVHDRRIDRTSTGTGPVSTWQLEKLEALDWAAWKNPWGELDDEAEVGDPEGASFLTLERLLDLVKDWGKPVELAIETKHPTRYAGLVERRLVELLDRYGWARPRRTATSPVRIMSFSWISLRRCLEMAPRVPRVYLMERVPIRLRDGSLPLGASVAGPSIDIVRAHPEYVEKVHAAGHQVAVWVANTPSEIALCAGLGVDVIITDNPADALRQLTRPV